jgi:hypothetical protein
MAKHWLNAGRVDGSSTLSTSNRNYFIQGISTQDSSVTLLRVPFQTAGELSNYAVRVTANAHTTDVFFDLIINGSVSTLSITVATTLTGWFEDTDTLSVSPNDYAYNQVDVQTSGGSGNISFNVFSIIFNATSNTVSKFVSGRGSANIADTTVRYSHVSGGVTATTTETESQFKVKAAGTIKNLSIRIATNDTTSGSSLFTLRKNGADTALQISVAAGGSDTGLFEDTSDAVAISVDDLINYSYVNATANNLNLRFISSEYETTTGDSFLVSGSESLHASNTLRYQGLSNLMSTGNTSSTSYTNKIKFATTLRNMVLYVYSNSIGGAGQPSTVALTVNGSASALSISTTGTGWHEDNDDVAVVADDDLGYTVQTGTSVTNTFGISTLGIQLHEDVTPPPSGGGGEEEYIIMFN